MILVIVLRARGPPRCEPFCPQRRVATRKSARISEASFRGELRNRTCKELDMEGIGHVRNWTCEELKSKNTVKPVVTYDPPSLGPP